MEGLHIECEVKGHATAVRGRNLNGHTAAASVAALRQFRHLRRFPCRRADSRGACAHDIAHGEDVRHDRVGIHQLGARESGVRGGHRGRDDVDPEREGRGTGECAQVLASTASELHATRRRGQTPLTNPCEQLGCGGLGAPRQRFNRWGPAGDRRQVWPKEARVEGLPLAAPLPSLVLWSGHANTLRIGLVAQQAVALREAAELSAEALVFEHDAAGELAASNGLNDGQPLVQHQHRRGEQAAPVDAIVTVNQAAATGLTRPRDELGGRFHVRQQVVTGRIEGCNVVVDDARRLELLFGKARIRGQAEHVSHRVLPQRSQVVRALLVAKEQMRQNADRKRRWPNIPLGDALESS